MKRASLAAIVLALGMGLAGAAHAQDVDEWERPFTGYLPDPARGERDAWADVIPRAYGCHVLDAETGRPLPGATLAYHAEVLDEDATDASPLLGRTIADLDGHAWLPASDWPGGTHWLVTAPGYAPAHSFTFAPARTVRLTRGADVVARLLDPLGRPVVGARVDYFRGCPHAPVSSSARTGPGGRFTLHDAAPGGGFLWVVSAAGRYVYNDPLYAGRFGARRQDLVLSSGWTARGRLVDTDDRPLAGAVVRFAEFPRGPVTRTDAAGAFVLHGLPEDSLLRFPANGSATRFGEWRDRTPFVVQLDRFGSVVRAAASVPVEVRLSAGDGLPLDPLDLRFTNLGSGHAWLIEGDEDEVSPLERIVRCNLPPGEFEVTPATPFEDATFRARRVRIPAEGRIDISVERQPRLAIDGALPQLAHEVTLVVARGEIDCDDPDDLPPVPSSGPAVVRVRPDIDAPVLFFPVAPVQGGTRRVRIRVPEPHRIRLASGAPIEHAELRYGALEPTSSVDDDGFVTTYAEGPMQIDVESPAWDGARRFEIDLPVRPTEIALSHADARPVPDEPEEEDEEDAARPSGPCTLRLVCLDPEGEPLACAVSVAGASHWTAEGVLELSGLSAGAHHIVASPRDPDYEGRELRLVLSDGVRERTLRFPAR